MRWKGHREFEKIEVKVEVSADQRIKKVNKQK